MGKLMFMLAGLSTVSIHAAVYYASPYGAPEGAGTQESPYDIKTACAKLRDNTGDEVKLLPGTYGMGSVELARIDYGAKLTGVGSASDVVLDGEGAGKPILLSYGSRIQNLTLSNYRVKPLSITSESPYPTTVVSNCVVTGVRGSENACSSAGGGDTLIVDCEFRDNVSDSTYGCALYVLNKSKTTVLRSSFVDNRFTGWSGTGGGAIHSQSGITVDSCVISNNAASAYGGGISLLTGNAFITNTLFYGNTSTVNGGGGLYSSADAGATNTIVDCVFRANCSTNATACGAGVRLGGSGVTVLKGCAFEDNLLTGKSGYGAGVCGASGPASALIERCTFSGNRAIGDNGMGGACHFETYGDGIVIRDCVFTNNCASERGAAVCVRGPGAVGQYLRLSVSDSLFVDNVATNSGGAFGQDYDNNARTGYVGGFTNCVFRRNMARTGGAFLGVGATFSKCVFDANRTDPLGGSSDDGGALYVNSRGFDRACNPESTNRLAEVGCVFTNNCAGRRGAAIFGAVETAYAVSDSTFVDNSANGGTEGGAVSFAGSVKEVAVDRCVFRANRSAPYGAAVGFRNADAKMVRCTIRNSLFIANANDSNFGGALALTRNCEVANCTFHKNVCAGQGGAIYCPDAAGSSLYNCLFHDNRLTHQTGTPSCDVWGDTLRASCTTRCFSSIAASFPAERGNITAASPKFVDAANGDCRLGRRSPCVNAGVNQPWMTGATDLSGSRRFPRIINGVVDIGCYEFRPDPGLILSVR